MDNTHVKNLLQKVRSKTITVEHALKQLRSLPYEDIGFASIDHHRAIRQGFPEVIFCEGKTKTQVVDIARTLMKRGNNLLATRVQPEIARSLKRAIPKAVYHEAARVVSVETRKPIRKGRVLIVTAGTSDIPVAEEARITAEVMGSSVQTLFDVGVAGLHRLLDRQELLVEARVIVVAAGMDGVLPSVVGGLVDRPIIAVPTSQGYGANFGGLAALLTMLNACSSGIGVMNIDNGFGAGCLAHRINLLGESL
ncbi:MAG: nickel pincer cofactor biosynthesis protein LarB [Nitrospirales bacterium]|nr:nickel pincer cofactor biosynthesis protein LarB [Nitrospira sp.]MDR4500946.1 nickel pincer cofactor biosynthesis protein LarB [Nitrospirales bacterium]